jgi:predicted ATPase
VELLEREHFLRTLQEYAQDAAAGSGRFVLIAGEVGVGKTALGGIHLTGLSQLSVLSRV